MSVHLLLAGGWAECPDDSTCALMFHVPGLSVAEAEVIPESKLYPLLEIADPPTRRTEGGINKQWLDADGELHRDYDLPSLIDGSVRAWHQHGRLHREGDRPATVQVSGGLGWYRDGMPYRDGDQPAWITFDGHKHWYKGGVLHRDNGKPAILYSDGREEYWAHGKLVGRSGTSLVERYTR